LPKGCATPENRRIYFTNAIKLFISKATYTQGSRICLKPLRQEKIVAGQLKKNKNIAIKSQPSGE
ncbi:TPA: hypothetical protein ACHIWC_004661, partial [Pseudomonas aeruginosa]